MQNETVEIKAGDTKPANSRHLLLVDDDPLYLKMVRGWLAEKYLITAVKSGSQALAYLDGHTADMILLDFEMPEMSGSQVFEKIRQNPHTSGIPVIFLTGRSDRESIQHVMGQSPEGYLLKTMERDSIVKAIDTFLSSGILPEETEEQT
ncbi:MAG: response regulator [Lachnospiraceae bacterium]|nr:response regulator [Lachnospiraceae bacterium]